MDAPDGHRRHVVRGRHPPARTRASGEHPVSAAPWPRKHVHRLPGHCVVHAGRNRRNGIGPEGSIVAGNDRVQRVAVARDLVRYQAVAIQGRCHAVGARSRDATTTPTIARAPAMLSVTATPTTAVPRLATAAATATAPMPVPRAVPRMSESCIDDAAAPP